MISVELSDFVQEVVTIVNILIDIVFFLSHSCVFELRWSTLQISEGCLFHAWTEGELKTHCTFIA